jgi:hypothetical protein
MNRDTSEPTREERRAQRRHDRIVERLNDRLWRRNLPPFGHPAANRLKREER